VLLEDFSNDELGFIPFKITLSLCIVVHILSLFSLRFKSLDKESDVYNIRL
jgi:hypothetical protein